MSKNEETLTSLGQQPKSAEVDGQKVEQHSLTEQIELDRYLESKKAVRSGHGFKITKMSSSGA